MDSLEIKLQALKTFQLNLEESWWRGMVVRLGSGGGAGLRRHQLVAEIGCSLHLHSGPGGLVSGVGGACTSTRTRAVSSVPPEPPAGYLVESVSEIATKKVKQ